MDISQQLTDFNPIHNVDDCSKASEMSASRLWNAIRIFQCVVTCSTLILLVFLLCKFKNSHLLFHRNLLCFMANIVFLLALHSAGMLFSQLRALTLFLLYQDSCEYLTPVWIGILVRLLSYVYLLSFSLLHIGITIERARQLFLPKITKKREELVVFWVFLLYGQL
uniref:Uncharacterized protein n=1 Tax=Ditylenchus dipsaci TaxID=166011 RepID=A0A915E9J6_9BILA